MKDFPKMCIRDSIYSDASCIQNDTIMKNLFGYFRDEISDVMNFMSINNNLFNSDSLLS